MKLNPKYFIKAAKLVEDAQLTGSREEFCCVALNKVICNEIVANYHIQFLFSIFAYSDDNHLKVIWPRKCFVEFDYDSRIIALCLCAELCKDSTFLPDEQTPTQR